MAWQQEAEVYLFPPLPLPTSEVLITQELWPLRGKLQFWEDCMYQTMVLRRNTFQSLLSPYHLTVSINPHFTHEETDTEGSHLLKVLTGVRSKVTHRGLPSTYTSKHVFAKQQMNK